MEKNKKELTNQNSVKNKKKEKSWNIFDSKYDIYNLLFWIIFLGAIVPFAVQFILPFIFKWNGKSIPEGNGVEVWNTYVSIVLGVVATVTSLISLGLSFKNTDESNRANNQTTEMLAVINERMHQLMTEQEKFSQEQERFKEKQNEMSNYLRDSKNTDNINESELRDFKIKVLADEKKRK